MKKRNHEVSGLPGERVRHKKFRGLRIFTGIVIAAMTAGAIYFQGVKNSHKKELDKTMANYHAIKENVSRVEKVKQQRIVFFKNRLLTDFPMQYSFVSANFIRRLSLIDSPGINLANIEIIPQGQGILFSIAGNVEKGNKIAMESKFSRFKSAVEAFDDIFLISSEKKQGESSEKGPAFTIIGEIGLL
jgi:hypothetical protein